MLAGESTHSLSRTSRGLALQVRGNESRPHRRAAIAGARRRCISKPMTFLFPTRAVLSFRADGSSVRLVAQVAARDGPMITWS